MSPDSFDELDRLLAGGMAELAPDVDGGDEALAALRPRFQRARTRARVVKIGGACALLLVIGSVATLVAPNSRRSHVEVTAPPTTRSAAPQPTRTSTTKAPTTTVPKTSSTSLPTSGPSPTTVGSNTPAGSGASPSTPHTIPDTTPTTESRDDHGGTGGGSDPGRGGSPGTTNPQTHMGISRYRSPGGSVRVRFTRDGLRLISVSPGVGYHARVEKKRPELIDVRFYNDHAEWRLRVRVEKDLPVHDVDRV